MADAGKKHVSLVICGHVDAGKSTTTGHLIFDLGGITEREMEKLKAEADAQGKSSFAFAFYMDKSKEERARGVTIACTTKEFYTDSYHYTIIDAPGHRDFIKNMITGASQADVAVIMVPADGNFTTAIAKGNHKQGIVQGQTRQHSRLINLLGVKQVAIGVNKMDCDVAGYKESRYNEIKDEMTLMLTRVGYKKAYVTDSVPIVPISGWVGDNLVKHSAKMPWWKGQEVKTMSGKKVTVCTLLDVFENMIELPVRDGDKPMRTPISGVYKIKGVGDVVTGRVEQGSVKPGVTVVFLPTHSASKECKGKVFTVEMHHKQQEQALCGDNVGLNMKGLNKENYPRVGDVMVLETEKTLFNVSSFKAAVQVLDHPGELKAGYTPIGFVRTGRSAIKMAEIIWKKGKSTGGAKAEKPANVKANEMAYIMFEPMQPFVCDKFKNCEGLGRIAIMEGNGVVMLGKIMDVTEKKEVAKK
jgi:elongation factor 1-alpha